VSALSVETFFTQYLNVALLFCVALEPFLFYVLETTSNTFLEYSSAVFGLDIGIMQVLLAGMSYLVIRQEKHKQVSKSQANYVKMFKISMFSGIIAATIFLVSISNVFWISNPTIGNWRFFMWDISVALIVLTRAFVRVITGKGS